MRKVIFAITMSVDGCIGHMNMSLAPDEEVGGYFNDLIRDADLIAYGRKMYEIMFPYWADEANWTDESDTEFGKRLTAFDKVVFSRTLESAVYNTRVVSTDPAEELLKLKQAPGKNIFVGTVSMIPQLARAGVIDEYHIVVAPVIIGQGTRLVESSLPERLQLKLVESKAFKSGCAALKYVKR